MRLRGLVEEDFVNYKVPSLFLAATTCDFKCCKEAGIPVTVCQNQPLMEQPVEEVSAGEILRRYLSNNITEAVVIGGMEPMLQVPEVYELISYFRRNECDCDFVIYTGYYKEEIPEYVKVLALLGNVVIKFGRYVPDLSPRYDEVIGVTLASCNQYAERIS